MTWEEIIKLRAGPMREKDAEIHELRISSDKKDRDKASDIRVKEHKKLSKELQNTAISLASLFAREKMRITEADGRESKTSYTLLAKLMEQIAELYTRMYGEVDRIRDPDSGITANADEYMRATAAKFREVAQTLKKK